ncbi:hypothetical protein [Alsobacter sp. R-9]
MVPRMYRLVVAVAAGLSLVGCNQYIDRIDTVDFSDGNAVRANMAQHIIDPWSPASKNTQIGMDGSRARAAVQAYRCRPAGGALKGQSYAVAGASTGGADGQSGGATQATTAPGAPGC